MQDATRTSEAWAALAGSLVNGVDPRDAQDARPRTIQRSNASGDSNPARKSGKKRIRRIQLELSFFRHQVRDLELQLKRIKLQNSSPRSELKSLESVQNLVGKGSGADQNSVWNGIAERQLKERLRVEEQRQQLKQTHVESSNMSMELQKLLRKCDEHQQEVVDRLHTEQQQQRYWDFEADPADEIYAHQLATVARMRLEMQRQRPSRTLFLGSGLFMGQEMVRWDPSVKAGFKLETQYGTMLPFQLDVVADAYWRFFGCGYGMERVDRSKSDRSMGTVARSFKIRTDFEGFTSKLGGKYTACRHVDEDGSVTIVWVGSGDVHEIDGVKFSGTQVHKRGCFKLRRVVRQGSGQQSTSTVVEASFETIPLFHDSVVDKNQQTQALLDGINKSYTKVNKLFCQKMGSLLVEEDWKATFGHV